MVAVISFSWDRLGCPSNFKQGYSSWTGFVSEPMFSISIVTESPSLSSTGGLRAMPTPCGVPVKMTVPGANIALPLRNSIKVGTARGHAGLLIKIYC